MIIEILSVAYTDKRGVSRTRRVCMLQCNQCKSEFQRDYTKFITLKEYHFCSRRCKNISNQMGGFIYEKMKQTSFDKHGIEFASQSEAAKMKRKATCVEKYGVESPLASSVVREKIENTCKERFGEKSYLSTQQCRDELKTVSLDRWGVRHPSMSDDVKKSVRKTVQDRFNVDNISQSPKIKQKKKETTLKNHGVENPFQSRALMSKVDQVNARQKRHATLKRLGRYGKSMTEDHFYEILSHKFGESNIERQVNLHVWLIDFYIKSINTYVQFDGVYWHGLDRPIEEIALHKTLSDATIETTYKRDIEQNKWCAERGVRFVRITDREFKRQVIENTIENWLDLISCEYLCP